MIKVTVYKDSAGAYLGFGCIGHAGFADRGKDVVCAGVSMLVINCLNSIEKFSSTRFESVRDEKTGLWKVRFTDRPDEKAELLMDSMVLGIKGVESNYGADFVRFKEVVKGG